MTRQEEIEELCDEICADVCAGVYRKEYPCPCGGTIVLVEVGQDGQEWYELRECNECDQGIAVGGCQITGGQEEKLSE